MDFQTESENLLIWRLDISQLGPGHSDAMKSPSTLLFLCATTSLLAISAHADTVATAVSAPAFPAPAVSAPVFPASSGVHLNARSSSSSDPGWAKFASGSGNALFLAAGTLLPLVTDGKDGSQHAVRTIDALAVSTLLTSGLKILTHEKRPDGSDFKSFPSGHASAAFTVATMQAQFHPRQALLWYGGATAIAASRVTLHRHYTRDVVAGAALGFLSARLELKQQRGFILRPFIQSRDAGGAGGLTLSKIF